MTGIEYNSVTLDPPLAAVADAVSDMTRLWTPLANCSPFAPCKQSTLDRYAKLRLTFGAPMNASVNMRNTLFYETAQSNVEYGSNAIHATVMQFGAAKSVFGKASDGSSIP
ncbi:hypothetical protein A9Q94_12400 [Rhodobacterales bacterium 56_14_T64]|nr:hypothetical protein A9Q94_12400 [Rhodobacterales bacterium 56_14_T64]